MGSIRDNDPVYANTRKMILSEYNPLYYKGSAAEGIGGPDTGKDMIWPMSIIMRGLTSSDPAELKAVLKPFGKLKVIQVSCTNPFIKMTPGNLPDPGSHG